MTKNDGLEQFPRDIGEEQLEVEFWDDHLEFKLTISPLERPMPLHRFVERNISSEFGFKYNRKIHRCEFISPTGEPAVAIKAFEAVIYMRTAVD